LALRPIAEHMFCIKNSFVSLCLLCLLFELASSKVAVTYCCCYADCMLVCAAGSDVLRALYNDLTTMLDACVVAANMYQCNALTLKELQSIQSLKNRPIEAAETLLNIIMEQPDAVYLCFLDVMKHSQQQQHIYKILVENGYKGRCSSQKLNFDTQ